MCIYRAVKSREGQAGPVPLPPFSAFWPLIIFIVNDSKKELEKCYVLKTEIHYHWRKKSKQATNPITAINLVSSVRNKQHSDCVFPSGLWERISFN